MMKKKICMLGAFAVGKTSLVRRFVHTIFSDSYDTTVGVNIEKKEVFVGGKQIDLVIWDIHGEDDFQSVRMSYLRGASGCIYVIDGTRKSTIDVAFSLHEKACTATGCVPALFLVNKIDLTDLCEVDPAKLEGLDKNGTPVFKTSAKTGVNVEAAFQYLAEKLMG